MTRARLSLMPALPWRAATLAAVTADAAVVAVARDLPPVVGRGPLAPETRAMLDEVFADPLYLDEGDIPSLGSGRDLRVGWILVDLARSTRSGPPGPRSTRHWQT